MPPDPPPAYPIPPWPCRIFVRLFYAKLFYASPRVTAALFAFLRKREKEESHILLLDTHSRFIAKLHTAGGSRMKTECDTALIANLAVSHDTLLVVYLHNHPGGDPTPSSEDLHATLILQKTLHRVGVRLYDHIIIGRKRYCSLKQAGLLPDPFADADVMQKLRYEVVSAAMNTRSAEVLKGMIAAIE